MDETKVSAGGEWISMKYGPKGESSGRKFSKDEHITIDINANNRRIQRIYDNIQLFKYHSNNKLFR